MMDQIKLVLGKVLEELKLVNEDKHLEKYKIELLERIRKPKNQT